MSAPVLLLAPGHLGDPADLSPRVTEALRTATLVLVEGGAHAGLAASLRAAGAALPRLLPLPADGALDDDARAELLAELDRGGRVVLFGGEEGIPGYADPGAEVIRRVRAERPAVPIRSLGGSSVAGAALMASGLGVDRVTLLGVTTMDEPARTRKLHEVRRWVERLARPDHAVVVFACGADVAALAAVLARIRWLDVRMTVCVSLTLPEEQVFDGAPSQVLAHPLPPGCPAVVLVTSTQRPWHPRSWLAPLGRITG